MLLALLSVSAGRDRTSHPNHQRVAQSSRRLRSQPARSDGGLDDPATYAGAALLGGGLGGLVGGATMTALLVLGAALAESQTAVASVHQTGWTPLNATTAWVFELDPFTSGYRMASVLGAAIQLTVAIALGAAGMAAVALVLGRRPAIPAALALGLVYSALLYGVGLHVIVDAARDPDLVASAAPRWSWWAGSAVYGVLVAAFGAGALRRTSDLVSGRR